MIPQSTDVGQSKMMLKVVERNVQKINDQVTTPPEMKTHTRTAYQYCNFWNRDSTLPQNQPHCLHQFRVDAHELSDFDIVR